MMFKVLKKFFALLFVIAILFLALLYFIGTNKDNLELNEQKNDTGSTEDISDVILKNNDTNTDDLIDDVKIEWIDPTFEAYFTNGIGSKGYVTSDEASQIESLIILSNNIESNRLVLDDLIHFPNLKELTINNTTDPNIELIVDISSISNASSLEHLALANCNLTDVSPLSKLTNLQILLLSMNAISDVEPLSNLSKLEMLDLRKNPITDITSLQRLNENVVLIIDGNKLQNLEPINHLPNKEVVYE